MAIVPNETLTVEFNGLEEFIATVERLDVITDRLVGAIASAERNGTIVFNLTERDDDTVGSKIVEAIERARKDGRIQ